MNTSLHNIAQAFHIKGHIRHISPFGDGLINSTYLVSTDKQKYVLQKINRTVFKDIPALTNNKLKISEHIRAQNPHKSLQFVPTKEGLHYLCEKDEFWNMSVYIADTQSVSKAESSTLAYEAGKAVGEFQSLLLNIDINDISDSIANFHNTSLRIDELWQSAKEDIAHRKQEVEDLLEIAHKHESTIRSIDAKIQNEEIPKRLVHNDTKISNILFDQNQKALCMIDLDTCMGGSILHDFGDAVRSICNTGTEDSPKGVSFNIELFTNYAQGYLSTTQHFLKRIEKEHLTYAGALITYEQFVRFLTDYLRKDTYYKIQHAKHNLERACSQARLLQSMLSKHAQIDTIIKQNL